jgi:hypothetical protein
MGASACRLKPPSGLRHPLSWWISLVVCLTTLQLPAGAAEPPQNSYLSSLIARANAMRLADRREWHVLVHYREGLFGGYTSEADDPQFFLAADGQHDPAAELTATLTQLFSEDPVGRSKQPAQCAFIARYHWLKEELGIDDHELPPLRCERFEMWFNEMNAESITLIFASAFLNNPASMFGHTFLRVDRKGQTDQTRLLAYTINYAAEVPPGEGPLYPIKGIFGGYKGFFTTPPYYLKVQEYRDIDNRDIWEYRLNFSETQVRRVLMHAWELGNAYFDYYFFKENCSYHLLALLDYADPSLHLTDDFLLWTVPADTVRRIASRPGLIAHVAYRPSRSTVIKRKRESLPADQRALAQRLARDRNAREDPGFVRLTGGQRAFLLDLASDYLRYRIDTTKEPPPEWKERNRDVLLARSQLRIPSPDFPVAPFAKQPEIGHDTSRASLAGGWRNNDTFEEFSIRAGYHDLLDPEPGYTPDAQIELASVTLRHYNRADQSRIERATLVDMVSLSPIDSVFRVPSWKFNVGLQTIKHGTCQLCSNGVADAGIGAAVESKWLNREVFFAFAEAEGNASHAYEDGYRVGGGGTGGVLVDVTDRLKLMATGSYFKYALGEKSDDVRWFVGQRYTLARDWVLRLEYHHRQHDNDVWFALQAFF